MAGHMRTRARLKALIGSCVFLAVGLLWITFSDLLGQQLIADPVALTRYQMYKGFAFITATSVLFYAVLVSRPGLGRPSAITHAAGAPVTARLLLLVAATAVPLAALLGWQVLRETGAQRRQAEALLQRVADNAVLEADGFLVNLVHVADSLAARTLARSGMESACDPLLAEISSVHPMIREAVTMDLLGRLPCGTDPSGALTQGLDQTWLDRLEAAGGAAFGPLHKDRQGVWVLTVDHPLRTPQGRLYGAVRIVVPADRLAHITANPLPEGSAVSLIDTHDRIASRFPRSDAYIGRKATPLRQRWSERDPTRRTGVATGPDGTERMFVFVPVGATGWSVAAGVPVASLEVPVRRTAVAYAAAALLMLAGSTWLVLRVGRGIVEPLHALQHTAERVGAGELGERAPLTGPAELVSVAAGFNHMLDRLQLLQGAMADSEARHRTLIGKLSQNVPGVLFELYLPRDGKPSLLFASERVRDMFGLSASEDIGDPELLFAHVHPDDAVALRTAMEQSSHDLQTMAMQYRILLPGGTRHYLTQARPEAEPKGIRWFGCTVDVTGLQQARQELTAVNESLEQRIAERTTALASANEALEAFSYSISHDLRAPVQTIIGFSEATADAFAKSDGERASFLLGRIGANARRMDAMIDAFLRLARAGRAPLESVVHLDSMVRSVLAELDAPGTLKAQVSPLPRIRGDSAMLRQVWWNLLSNAIKYSAHSREPAVDVRWCLVGGEAVFEVRDNGTGFDAAHAARLFQPFQRLHSATEYPGIGVGLALVRRILQSHGGRIEAEAPPGGGALFRFTLPADRLQDAA